MAMTAFRPGISRVVPSEPIEPAVYEVTFPAEPIPVDGWKGHYSVVIVTNLPEATMVDLEYTDDLGEGGGCCHSVGAGVIQAPLVNNHCVERSGILQGSHVTVQVIVAPDYGFMNRHM